MKRILIVSFIISILTFSKGLSQLPNDTTAYLVTCGPGTETYSIYGHSALRIAIPEKNLDLIYNWGVFDFNTKNFAWKFAKGRLDYMLIAEPLKSFLQGYFFEQRYVYSQRLNINPAELRILAGLINENLKPENAKYRYDFFYDDCSTRIRDLIEKSVGQKLKYPPPELGRVPTFRQMVAKYQNPYPWLRFGVDLIMGSTSDKRAHFRDRMFLPIDLRTGLSETFVYRDGKMIPLLQNPEILLDFKAPVVKQSFLISPPSVLTLLIIVILILAGLVKSSRITRSIDIVIFSVFSILAILMIFFNFFTDHEQMRWNLNIIWLNPFIIICLLMLILNKPGIFWFRLVFYTSVLFLVIHFILPQSFNLGFLLLDIVLIIRTSIRGDFVWNPLTIDQTKS